MIGAIIQGVNKGKVEIDPLVYHRFEDRTSMDMVVDSCLLAPHLHKVVISVPLNERKNISGVTIGNKSKLNPSKRESLGRKPLLNYYNPLDEPLTGLYQAAMQNDLDHIVRVHANCPILPTWLINETILTYFKDASLHNKILSTGQEYNKGFSIDIFPFWMLAEAYIQQKNRVDIDYSDFTVYDFKNDGRSKIPNTDFNLSFESLDQVEVLDSLIYNMNNGYDIAEILEERNGDKQEDA